jgi:DNA-binding MarR family transcriptional regulator
MVNLNKKNIILRESTFELWRLIGRANHLVLLHRQRELKQHRIPVRQLWVLIAIKELGTNASLNEVAKAVERKPNVISSQTANMEKDGFIRRVKVTTKSNLLRLELTQKGWDTIDASRDSNAIKTIFASISNDERQQLEDILNKVIITAQKYHPVK